MRKILGVIAIAAALAACGKREEAVTATTTAAGTTAPQPAQASPAPTTTGPNVGQLMPAYTAKRLDGSAFDLAGERNKVVLLNVWATWCGPCRFEIPELQTAQNAYASRGFEVVGVSVDEGAPEAVKEFVDAQKMTYPIVLDPEGKVAALLDASVLPTTVLIDRQGRIVWKKIGAIMPKDDELTKAIEKAL
jgi:peroxiredoxin